jgi:hypothetical protein
MCSPTWVVELGKHQYEAGLRQPVPTQPTSKTVDGPPGAAPRPPPSAVTWPPTPSGWPGRPNGVFAGASTAISATSRPRYSCTPTTSRPKHLRHRSPVWLRRPVPPPGRRTGPAMATPTRASGKGLANTSTATSTRNTAVSHSHDKTSPSRRRAFIGPRCDRGIGFLMCRRVPHIETR